jgi:hypothetical protein
MVKKRVTVIGSRETPEDINKLLITYTNILVELGYAIASGGCPVGPDRSAFIGVYGHKSKDKSKHRIYISWDGMANLDHNPEIGIYNAQLFENYAVAETIAFYARGSWEGLGRGGRAHHTRNVYQVLWDDLCSLTDFVVCYAIPTGKHGKVKGGTSTAVSVATSHAIPVFNLYYPDVRERVERLVANIKQHAPKKEKANAVDRGSDKALL